MMAIDLYELAESLQNARDHIVVAKGDKINSRYHINCAVENVREAMKMLGLKEAEKDGNDH
jgi:hypothetical protein